MESIIEQLRVQDGKLFRDEQVMTLYVDVKRVVLDNVLLALKSPTGIDTIREWSPELEKHIVSSLTCRNVKNLLQDVVKLHAELLHTSKNVLQTPKIEALLKGMCMRLLMEPSVLSGQIQMLDPIKQDFVCREAFRHTLHVDCMVPSTQEPLERDDHHEDQKSEATFAALPKPEVMQLERQQALGIPNETTLQELPDIGPNDSASQIVSVMKPVLPDIASVAHRHTETTVGPSGPSGTVAPSASIAPIGQHKDNQTIVSTSTMMAAQMKMPKNFRRVVLEEDAYTVMSQRQK